jgi:hypothetical protein
MDENMLKNSVILAFLIILATSCGRSGDEKFPGINIPIVEMNKAFIVDDPPIMANSHKNNNSIILQLKNLSKNKIILTDSYGIKIFKKEAQNWIQIENNQGYSSGETVLQPYKEFPLGLLPDATPFILDLNKPIIIRIVFIGYEDTPEAKTVGAYYEFTLLP